MCAGNYRHLTASYIHEGFSRVFFHFFCSTAEFFLQRFWALTLPRSCGSLIGIGLQSNFAEFRSGNISD